MPELPEVETVVRDLAAAGLAGDTIEDARVLWRRTVAGLSVAAFRRRIAGRKVAEVARRGKFILLRLASNDLLAIHLRMSGRLLLAAGPVDPCPHVRLVLDLSSGRQLVLHDPRKFGRVFLGSDSAPVLEALGPEPLDPAFTPTVLATALRGRTRMLKPLLLDQTFVAGLGNIYVDEALFEARLHPCRGAGTLELQEATALHQAIRKVLLRGVRYRGTTLGRGESNFFSAGGRRGENGRHLKVYGRKGLPCPRCGEGIARIVVAQRGTHLCPACQVLPHRRTQAR